jgi:hypothetical protein
MPCLRASNGSAHDRLLVEQVRPRGAFLRTVPDSSQWWMRATSWRDDS